MTEAPAERSSAYWGRKPPEDALLYHWLNNPTTRTHMNRRISGRPEVGALQHWRNAFIPEQLGHVLSLGCAFGGFERHLLASGTARTAHGLDISADALASARSSAAAQGLSERITYDAADLNTVKLEPSRYDAIFAISSAHHIENLEGAFAQCSRALRPGGLFFLDEYIGPPRFQFDDTIMGIMNAILAILPERFKRPYTARDTVRDEISRMPLAWFEENDPSEAVRSDEIVSVLGQSFEMIDYRPYGGEILHMLLSEIAGNFLADSEEDEAILKLLNLLEDTLEQHNIIRTDFAAIVCRPK